MLPSGTKPEVAPVPGELTLVALSSCFSVYSCVTSVKLTFLSSESLIGEWASLYKLGVMVITALERKQEGQRFRVTLCYIVSSQGQPGLQTLSLDR